MILFRQNSLSVNTFKQYPSTMKYVGCSRKFHSSIWILVALVFIIVMLGGATRLTHSGLSIVEWKPITGAIPPLNDSDWIVEFTKYQQSPEYQKINKGMSLQDFKFIFWMEFAHRQLGRMIGILAFAIFIWSLISKKINSQTRKLLALIVCMVGLQGFIGWYMVKSGLSSHPHVSPYRLSLHLIMACAIILILFNVLISIRNIRLHKIIFNLVGQGYYHPSKANKIWSILQILCILLTILYGAFVAGHKAGIIYNTFPKMGNSWIPSEIFHLSPLWKNFFENHTMIQFIHRVLAFATIIIAFWGWIHKRCSLLFVSVIATQLLLGIVTLLYQVPTFLGTLHQGWAIIVLSSSYLLFLVYKSTLIQETSLKLKKPRT
ncbi:MAG: heme A synthase [Candidatus Puniceispirillum sp.]|nr:heme A synthase [Candidatus Pelagibacter sp.]MBA4283290.1 heme A synthase [Candidatus Puniceispirillum sp.]